MNFLVGFKVLPEYYDAKVVSAYFGFGIDLRRLLLVFCRINTYLALLLPPTESDVRNLDASHCYVRVSEGMTQFSCGTNRGGGGASGAVLDRATTTMYIHG